MDAEAKERISQIKNFESQKALDTLVSSSKADFVIFEPNDCSVSSSVTSTLNSKELETVGVRPSVCIPVSFTPRIFPTPSRESTHADEQEVSFNNKVYFRITNNVINLNIVYFCYSG